MTKGLRDPRRKPSVSTPVDASGFESFEPTASSNVRRVRYDTENERLHIEFRSGAYRYEGVPRKVFDDLVQAESVGAFIVANVRGVYSCDPEPPPT